MGSSLLSQKTNPITWKNIKVSKKALVTNQRAWKAVSSDTMFEQPMVCNRGSTSPKVLGPIKSAMNIGPSTNPRYSVGPFPSEVFVIMIQWEGLDRITFKSCAHYFLFFLQMISLQKIWKINFISSKKLFSFWKYSNFCISILPLLLPVSHCFRGWLKTNLIVHDVINCLNKNLITNFVWYLEKENIYGIETLPIDRVLIKKHFYGKIIKKMCTKSYSQTPF